MTQTYNIHIGLSNWSSGTYVSGDRIATGGNAYQCVTGGTSTIAPSGTSSSIAPAGPHRYWRLLMNSGISNAYDIAELQFRTTAGTSRLFSGGTATAAQNYSDFTGVYDAPKAADNDVNTSWSGNDLTAGQWWQYDYGAGNSIIVAEITMTTQNTVDYQQAPTSFTVQWSDNGSTWSTVTTFNPSTWTIGQTQTFSVPSSGGSATWKWLSAIDYSSVDDANTALPSSFTQPIIWQFWNDGAIIVPGTGNSYLNLTGHTTSTTNTLTLTCAPGESFRDTIAKGHTALAFNTGSGVSFTLPTANPGYNLAAFAIHDANVIFDGLQFLNPNGTNGYCIFGGYLGASNLKILNCLCDFYAQSGTAQVQFLDSCLITNSVFIDRQPNTSTWQVLKTDHPSKIVNCTFIAITNSPFGAALLANASSGSAAGDNIIRNCASFGYRTIGSSISSAGLVVVDHCVTDRTAVVNTADSTDGGNNLVSQSASNTFVSTTTDFRLKLGASCINAGVTDTTDIPLSTDIVGLSRPQGTAWDIGAFELETIRLRGGSAASGKAKAAQAAPARGFSLSRGRGVLKVVDPLTGSGRGGSRGKSSITSAKPLSTVGRSTAIGRLTVGAPVLAITARGMSAGDGVTTSTPLITLLSSRTPARAAGRTAITAILAVAAKGVSKLAARSAVAVSFAAVSRGLAKSQGRSNASRAALVAVRGVSKSRGAVAPLDTTGKAFGRGSSSGSAAASYTAPPTAPYGLTTVKGRAALSADCSFETVSIALSSGKAELAIDDINIALDALSPAQAYGQSGDMDQAVSFDGPSLSITQGSGALSISQPIQAFGYSSAVGISPLDYFAYLTTHSFAKADGGFDTTATLTAAPQARGKSTTYGLNSASYDARMANVGRGAGTAKGQIDAAHPLTALAVAQLSGQIGASSLQRLAGRGVSGALGLARPLASAPLQGVSQATSWGLSALTVIQPMIASGYAISDGNSAGEPIAALKTIGFSLSRSGATGRFLTALATTSQSNAASRTRLSQQALVSGLSSSGSFGRAPPLTGVTSLTGSGHARSFGRSGTVIFAPIELSGGGYARGDGSARSSHGAALLGTTVGLSAGRCAVIASALLMASGRTHATGAMSTVAAGAIGIQSRGLSRASGRFYSRSNSGGYGQAKGSGTAILAGYYNTAPDTVGPRLSTIGQTPVFDSMDVGDVDFVSWDWSARTSAIRDPIIAATVTAYPSGLTVGSPVVVGTIVQVRIGASLIAETFTLRCTVTLRSGRVLHWSAPLPVAAF